MCHLYIRNAILQLHRSFLNIFLGQSSAGLRPLNIEVIYFLYPDVVRFLFRTLVGLDDDVSLDSTTAILSFFLESHFSDDNFLIAYTRDINEIFVNVFVDLVLYNEVSGNFAARVISSLCTNEKIPGIIVEIVDYIQVHFHKMLKNIFRNITTLLKGLYLRYTTLDVQIAVCDKYRILVDEGFQKIIRYLSAQSNNYRTLFLMLQINIVSMDQCFGLELFKKSRFTYEERMGVQNYIPYLLKSVPIGSLNNVIKIILNSEVPIGFKSLCLSNSIARFLRISSDDINVVSSICDTLVVSLLNSFQLNCQYSNSICSNLVLYLLQKLKKIRVNPLLISFVRGQYQKININNVYVTSVVAALLSKDLNLLDCDKQFIKSVIKSIKDSFIFEVVEKDFYLASTIIYYFKCADKTDKLTLLIIVFRFLFEEETCDEALKFVSLAFNIRKTSLLPSTRNLLNKDKLLMYLSNYEVAKFYVQLLIYLRTINDHGDKKDGAFNVIDVSYVFLYKKFLKKIIKKELKDQDRVLEMS
ncbi:uncharacterized protein LOC108738176 [Agrilus planipennis]|uniref:Uncharacterized protein LOC108738176 n=1 Tax=Agrilus planipennis TaxID=224129 RepID=A0A1W4X2E8_AGRPL|nr:uncharacterized protein LOC108738176 [Agrilus planipennis]